MSLVSEELSVWEISFRWAGFDPDRVYPLYPLEVKDNFKLLMDAVLNGQIYCETLLLAKRPSGSIADPQYYVRTHLDEIYNCIWGKRYNRKLLHWALISRDDFFEWCERRGVPLPEFWFPQGWKYDFEWPEFGTRASWARHQEPSQEGGFSVRFELPDNDESTLTDDESNEVKKGSATDTKNIIKLCAQNIAIQIWKEEKDKTIAEMARDERVLKYSGAVRDHETIRKWLREVAPSNVKGRPGRPKKGKS